MSDSNFLTPEEIVSINKGTYMSDSKWGLPHVLQSIDWNTPYGYYDPCAYRGHKWVETGSCRTWCKECDVDGDLDPMTGLVTVVFRDKSDKHKRGEE